ncbi:abnormal spindle-like microcephaly-associated protein homolog [Diabrotica virgifera virgifera]|uniref:Abnormal spindle-like microcephaly-associated protein homolog n=1 Tax=Diabrotica virgifera virgifera TaxID=50390 RepID=A0A6P7F607_DIAVI|nr:abnormal spindle-like microcephaly-associated protein homolog [Diabrotica virgifera virgifera]
MFFQISPVRREKKPKPTVKEKSPEKIEILSLGPFTVAPKLFFDEVKIGEPATCKLLLRNPTKQDMSIFLTKKVPLELNVRYNWESATIHSFSEVMFEITWTPMEKEASYHKISFENNTRTVHRDVPIVFKTASPSKAKPGKKTKLRKSPTKKYYPIKPPYISPKRFSPSPKKRSQYKKSPSPKKTFKPQVFTSYQHEHITQHEHVIHAEPIKYYTSKGKENVHTAYLSERVTTESFISAEKVNFVEYSKKIANGGERRGTFVLKRENSEIFNDSLEMNNENECPNGNTQIRPPLTSYNGDILTPDVSLGTYFKQKSSMPDSPKYDFEYKLTQLQSFCFTPTKTPVTTKRKTRFQTDFESTVKMTKENTFDIPDLPPNLNLSSETYTKSRLSSETYVKDNTSFETYVKGNLSGETYTKDNSLGNCENLSPLSTKVSPIRQKRFSPEPCRTPSLASYLQDVNNVKNKNFSHIQRSTIDDSLNASSFSSRLDYDSTLKANQFNFTKPVLSDVTLNFTTNSQFEGNITNDFNFAKPNNFTFSTPEVAVNRHINFQRNDPYSRPDISQTSFIMSDRPLSSIQEESFDVSHSTTRKKCDLDLTANFAKPGGGLTGPQNWSRKGGAALRVAKNTSGLNLKKFMINKSEDGRKEKRKEEAISEISRRDTNTVIIQNPFLLAATNMVDPFITPHLFVDESWIDEQELYFKKWLNSLLTPPQELYSEDKIIDVAKVWQECKKREVEAAPTKEEISNKYHVNAKLNSLRKSAQTLYRSKEITNVLSKVLAAVDNGKVSIRQDKDVHLNLSIKSDVMSHLLSYNPLWLRIGLETIYNEIIPLHSNSDIVGLSTFLINRLFKNPMLIKKYKSVHAAKYILDFNKFFLKKFLILVYFLDQAKTKKLIPHNPCLFCSTGKVKESKELLLMLARELLSAVGDITKFLKFSGYIVTHVQTYIHEFDYAVKNLGVDLRDGVRLTKVMEIILLKEELTNSLRVPAISRLQKVHNMKLVFDSLESAGYKILYDISPKDIVDGHREKTMSFLWQIIYKFEAPLMVKCASTIQTWFRSLPVVLKRRKLQRLHLQKENAARKIQNWYRRQKFVAKLEEFTYFLTHYLNLIKSERAAIKIQSYYRMYKQKDAYKKQIMAVNGIQKYCRGWLIRNFYKQRIKSAVLIQSHLRMFLERTRYLRIKKAVQIIQRWYKSKKQVQLEVNKYQKLKTTVIFVQQKWKARVLAKREKLQYEKLKSTVINVQNIFRANRLCRIERQKYQVIKSSTIYIQRWYRSIKEMRIHREQFLELKRIVIIVQQRYIALKIMKKEQTQYQQIKSACITLQQQYRAQKLMKATRIQYLQLRKAAIVFQQRYRAKKLMQKQILYYKALQKAVLIVQARYRAKLEMRTASQQFVTIKQATIKIQVWYRSILYMRRCREYYRSLQRATKILEQRYKAIILMRKEMSRYQSIKTATLVIQHRYRALIKMRTCQDYYNRLKLSTIFIQRKYRANKAAKSQRSYYLQMKNAAVTLQTRYRAKREMVSCRTSFISIRKAVVVVQLRYRANQLTKKTQQEYQQLLKYTVIIQRMCRAKRLMLNEKNNYLKLRQSVVNIQCRWRARKLEKEQKQAYQSLRRAVINIQQKWRAIKLAREEQKHYEILRRTVILIQQKWRAKRLCRFERERYLHLRQAALTVQAHWRARKVGHVERHHFINLRTTTIVVQRRFRATVQAKIERTRFNTVRNAVIVLQSRWRAYKLAKIQQEKYKILRTKTILIQRLWRAKVACVTVRHNYLELREHVSIIQQRWRAVLLYRKLYREYSKLKKAAIFIQQKWRGKVETRNIRTYYEKLRKAVIFVQNKWRSKRLARSDRKRYLQLKCTTVLIQRRWRSLKVTKEVKEVYQKYKKTVIFVQKRWKSIHLMRIEVQRYTLLKRITILVQRRIRANLEMTKQRKQYLITRNSVITIQRWYRRCVQARKEKEVYLAKIKAAKEIQRYARGYLVRRKYADYFTPEAREHRRIEKVQNAAAVKIQSYWKGYKTRSIADPAMSKIRERFMKANATAVAENTLQFKCNAALQTIALENSTLFHINHALEDIDYAIRRCKKICVSLRNLLPDQLYLMLSSTARSLPEMHACIYSVNILISFNKLKETKDYSFVPSYIEKLITLMMNWCDKESQLFPALCTLFWLFSHTPRWRRFILDLPNIKQKLEKIKGLVTRKANMVKKQVTKGSTVFASYKTLPTPSLLPDWGLEYKKNPFAFTNSVHGLNSLMASLSI